MGIVLSRMSHLQWNEDSHQVVARMDAIGGGILLLYLVFVFNRDQWLGYWVRGNDLAALTLSLTAGTMLGRVIGTVRGIRAVLVAWGFSVGRDA